MYQYEDCGLRNIFLKNGFSLVETPWGEAVSIENVEGLHKAIGIALIDRPEPLDGSEFRFLRKELGLSQKRFGGLFGVTDQTVANWEKGNSDLPKYADILIRLLFEETVLGDAKLTEVLNAVNERDHPGCEEEKKMELCEINGEWLCRQAA